MPGKFAAVPVYASSVDVGANNVYDINVIATDVDSNVATKAVAITVTDVVAGEASIDLGSYSKLIAPTQVDGKWYYYWDLPATHREPLVAALTAVATIWSPTTFWMACSTTTSTVS